MHLSLFHTTGTIVFAQIYQCQPSSEENGQFFTPNIPDRYFNPQNLQSFASSQLLTESEEVIYIFPVPSESSQRRNCSGNLTAVQYCYGANNSNTNDNFQTVFNLHFLTLQDGRYVVNTSVFVQATPSRNCSTSGSEGFSASYCCEKVSIIGINFPPSSFAFGVENFMGEAFHQRLHRAARIFQSSGSRTGS